MSDKQNEIELPEGALDPNQPWHFIGEENVRDWEGDLQDIIGWVAYAEYAAWRLDRSLEQTAMLLAARALTIGGRHVSDLLGAYHKSADTLGEFAEQRRTEHEDWRAANAEWKEQNDAAREVQAEGLELMREMLPIMKREIDELRDEWKGEDD